MRTARRLVRGQLDREALARAGCRPSPRCGGRGRCGSPRAWSSRLRRCGRARSRGCAGPRRRCAPPARRAGSGGCTMLRGARGSQRLGRRRPPCRDRSAPAARTPAGGGARDHVGGRQRAVGVDGVRLQVEGEGHAAEFDGMARPGTLGLTDPGHEGERRCPPDCHRRRSPDPHRPLAVHVAADAAPGAVKTRERELGQRRDTVGDRAPRKSRRVSARPTRPSRGRGWPSARRKPARRGAAARRACANAPARPGRRRADRRSSATVSRALRDVRDRDGDGVDDRKRRRRTAHESTGHGTLGVRAHRSTSRPQDVAPARIDRARPRRRAPRLALAR